MALNQQDFLPSNRTIKWIRSLSSITRSFSNILIYRVGIYRQGKRRRARATDRYVLFDKVYSLLYYKGNLRWLRWEYSGKRSLKLWDGFIHSPGLCHSMGKSAKIQRGKSSSLIIKCLRNESQFCCSQSKWVCLLRSV